MRNQEDDRRRIDAQVRSSAGASPILMPIEYEFIWLSLCTGWRVC